MIQPCREPTVTEKSLKVPAGILAVCVDGESYAACRHGCWSSIGIDGTARNAAACATHARLGSDQSTARLSWPRFASWIWSQALRLQEHKLHNMLLTRMVYSCRPPHGQLASHAQTLPEPVSPRLHGNKQWRPPTSRTSSQTSHQNAIGKTTRSHEHVEALLPPETVVLPKRKGLYC